MTENIARREAVDESAQRVEDERWEEFNTIDVATVSAGHAIHDTYSAFLNPLLPTFIERLLLSKTQAGLLTVFMRWPSIVQPLVGHLSDRYHLRELFILAPAVTAIVMSMVGIAPSYGVLAALLIVAGASSASLHAVGPAIAGRRSGRKLGRGMGIWMVGGELGRMLGPITIAAAVQWLTVGGMPWLMIGGIAASVALWVRLERIPFHQPATIQEADGSAWRAAWTQMRTILAPLIGIAVARSFVVATLSTYLPIYLDEQGAPLWFVGAALSVYEGAGVVAALLGGSVSDRFGRRLTLFVSFAAVSPLILAFLAVGGVLRPVLLVGLGLTALSVTPVMMALVQETAPDHRALATGLYFSMSFIISSLATVALGVIADRWGTHWTFVTSAAAALIGLPFIFLVPRGGRGAKSVEGAGG